jgi:hypothetical protein
MDRRHGESRLKGTLAQHNGLDDSPADIHYQACMECMDCHTSGEMHNELKFYSGPTSDTLIKDMQGAIWAKHDNATEVECVHCHGNLEYRAVSNAIDIRNPIKKLIVCPEPNESFPGYTAPDECSRLGRGRWVRSKRRICPKLRRRSATAAGGVGLWDSTIPTDAIRFR